MAREVHLNVLLPKNRDRPRWIRVEIDGFPERAFRTLGGGSTSGVIDGKKVVNPSRNPFMQIGNTPVSDYVSPGLESTSGWKQSSYGPWGLSD